MSLKKKINDTEKKFQKLLNTKSFSILFEFIKINLKENFIKIFILTFLSTISGIVVSGIVFYIYKIISINLGLLSIDFDLFKNSKFSIEFLNTIDAKFILINLSIIYFLLVTLETILNSSLITNFIYDYKVKILQKVIKINFHYFALNNAGDIGYVYQACVNRCSSYPNHLSKIIYNLIFIFFLLILLLNTSHQLFIFYTIAIGIVLFLFFFLNKISIYYNKKYIDIYNFTNSKIYELIDSIKLISQIKNYKSYEKFFFKDIFKIKNFVSKYLFISSSINNFLNYALLLSLLIIILLANKYTFISGKTITTFTVTGIILAKVFQGLLNNLTSLLNMSSNFNEIKRILSLSEKPMSKSKIQDTLKLKSLNIKNISFIYPGQNKKKLLNNVNLNFVKGKSYLISGKSGSGKSTLFSLIYGFFPPDSGKILINNSIDIKKYISEISYVTQDHFFINDNIYENLKLFNDKLTIGRAQEILNLVDLNLSLKKIVGNQGRKLSGGQKAKITLARCLINSPKILLIDESLSSIDNKSRGIVLSNLKKIKQNMIQIFITHESYNNFKFDRVYNLEKFN
jgi:ABC-type bacteriocin/lantibiotic exporter with double-glycine peptidase domain